MAQTPEGILGHIEGTVGTVTGASWKKVNYIRMRSGKRKGPSSPDQVDVQLRFSLIQNFLHTMAGLIKLTWRRYAENMTEFNAAFSYNFHNGIGGTNPDYVINYKKTLVSRGELPNANAPQATVTGTSVFFTWRDNSGTGTATATDKAVLVVFCPNLNLTIYSTNVGTRTDGSAQIDAVNFRGETVETWIAFLSAEGEEASPSLFTGELVIG